MSLFKDPDFNYFENWRGRSVEWKRPFEIRKNPVFIDDDFVIDDIDQGNLGNCWFLSSVGAVLQFCPDRLQNCLPKNRNLEGKNYNGEFTFKFYDLGKLKSVTIDDRLPTRNGLLLFTSSNHSNEFWSALLEKAFAKFQGGCYKKLKSGKATEGMQCLADMITEQINIKNVTDEELVCLFKSPIACCAATIGGECRPTGIVAGHGYVINRCVSLRTGEHLVEITNPHGSGEWTGDWSDKCPKWKDHLEYKPVEDDDGVFFMCIQDFRKYFEQIYCGLNENDWNEITPSMNHGSFKNSKNQLSTLSGNARGKYHQWMTGFESGDYPVFEFTKTSGKDSELFVKIFQKNLRRSNDDKVFLGFEIVQSKTTNTGFGDVHLKTAGCNTYRAGENFGRFTEIPPGDYKLICSTYDSGKSCDFVTRLYETKATQLHQKETAEIQELNELKLQVQNLTRQVFAMDIDRGTQKELLTAIVGTLTDKIRLQNK